jgi:hypothetical protein
MNRMASERRSGRPFLAAAAVLAAACLEAATAGAAHAAEKTELPRQVVRDLHYGDTLFHFYQDRYFGALTTLMVSQHFGRVRHHAEDAEVLRGGLLLSFGLHREAGEVFARLLEGSAAPSVRDRAWYYLAKIRYQRGFLAEAQEALARIGGTLPGELQEDRVLLEANVRLARADYAGAAAVLQALPPEVAGSLYARFNLGVALVKTGEATRGMTLLDEVGRAQAAQVQSEELKSLRDKANVALGFAAMQEERPEAARAALERVRLESPHANKALLGFGWAAAALKQPTKALVPWQELLQRDASDAAVLESRLAVPYALTELKAFGKAQRAYEEALAAYEHEGAAIDESVAALRAGKLLDGLLGDQPAEEMGWFWSVGKLPQMPHAGHLAPVLAEHGFQEALKNLRDLKFLQANLAQWSDTLAAYQDMLANRREAYAQRLPKVLQQAGTIKLDETAKRRDALAAEFMQAQADGDGAALADARERALMERLARVEAVLATMGADPETETARRKARLAAGALKWDLAREFPARAWEATKGLKAIDQQLEQARARATSLAQAQRDEPAKFDAFAARLAALDGRVRALAPQVQALAQEQQSQLQDMAVAALQSQKERLAEYTLQARFAIAQLVDRAYAARSGNDASKP